MEHLTPEPGRGGITLFESERMSPALAERAHRAIADRGLIPGPQPSEDDLIRACSGCDHRGYYRQRWPEGAVDTGRCRHYLGILALLIEREGTPVTVRKPFQTAVA